MKIAVTMRIIETEGYVEPRDAISQDWEIYLQKIGLTPIFIPNALKDSVAYVEEVGVEAVMLSNGENAALAKDNDGHWTGSARDRTEAKLLDWAVAKEIPVLGICRGMQFLNYYFGGSLEGDIEGHVTKAHPVAITHSFFKNFYGVQEMTVNSYHRSAVTNDTLAQGLIPWATAGNIIEAVVHESYPILGMIWHPERQKPLSEKDQELIQKFLRKEINFAGGLKSHG